MFDYYDYDFDQQGLAAQDRPVFVNAPQPQRPKLIIRPQKKSKVFTLYFSGTSPGDFSTKVTRLPVDHNGQPILSRNKELYLEWNLLTLLTNIYETKLWAVDNVLKN